MNTWSSIFQSMTGQHARQAMLISEAWKRAARSCDQGLLMTILHNMHDPMGICAALDHSGVQPPATPPEAES